MPARAVYGALAARAEGGRMAARSWPAPMRSPTPACAASPRSGTRRWRRRLTGARVMLYRGDPGETFCLALAEAQAMGVPAVVTSARRGRRAGQRRRQRAGGARTTTTFAAAAIAVLRDDALWRRWHLGALEHQRGLSWDVVAAHFEALMR